MIYTEVSNNNYYPDVKNCYVIYSLMTIFNTHIAHLKVVERVKDL